MNLPKNENVTNQVFFFQHVLFTKKLASKKNESAAFGRLKYSTIFFFLLKSFGFSAASQVLQNASNLSSNDFATDLILQQLQSLSQFPVKFVTGHDHNIRIMKRQQWLTKKVAFLFETCENPCPRTSEGRRPRMRIWWLDITWMFNPKEMRSRG